MRSKPGFYIQWLLVAATVVIVMGPPVAYAAVACYDCHGTDSQDMRPEDSAFRNPSSGGFPGNHRTHVGLSATPASCEKCHPGSSRYISGHRDRMIRVAPRINASPLVTPYNNRTTAWQQTAEPQYGTCSNVNCHFENASPTWTTAPLNSFTQCNTCHGAPPADGSHGKKHGAYYGYGTVSCTKCHFDHTGEGNPFSHATSVGHRGLAIQFTTTPNHGGSYSGNVSYPGFLPSQGPSRNGTCTDLYCHSDALGRKPNVDPTWSGATTTCVSCHRGRTSDAFNSMTSGGHSRLVGAQWIRKYPCTYCHAKTVESVTPVPGKPPVDGAIILPVQPGKHVNGTKDVDVNEFWKIDGVRKSYPLPTYNSATKSCDNLYCHSDGTVDPDPTRDIPWNQRGTSCNSCHGHELGKCVDCHDGVKVINGKVLSVQTGWPAGEEWKSAMPMFTNEGANKPRANSHPRHLETSFSCDECHSKTITNGGECTLCHNGGISGGMREQTHLNAAFHVNKVRDVSFKQGGTYNALNTGIKSCSSTKCHTGDDPVWGASINSEVICLSCHGTYTKPDLDDFGSFNNIKAQINMNEWKETGHGRTADKGAYKSGNPPANFPGNPCWYCHDNTVLHKDSSNPYRLRKHPQFNNRFEKECVYCHMEGKDYECFTCHNDTLSLSHQLKDLPALASYIDPKTGNTHPDRPDHTGFVGSYNPNVPFCTSSCHATDATQHNSGAGRWSVAQKNDVKNQYMMMGVCLQCHDDDAGGKCNGCHNGSLPKYQLGFDPGTGYIKPVKARASSVHFGHKHYQGYKDTGVWKGGKFCWDCHDPHGDSNIYMIQDMVATETDGTFGIPVPNKRAKVVFTQKNTGTDYVKTSGTIDGICNVCHSSGSQHYRNDGGDGHNSSYVCTKCHEHKFGDSHADEQSCSSCHNNKPVPRHSAFGLPRDCTKCHSGNVGSRVDIMGQFKGNSHHIQGAPVTNKQCYVCHWEATQDGLIDVRYHEGFNYKTYSSTKNAKVDLVILGQKSRPTVYREYSTAAGRATAVQFTASRLSSPDINAERKESAKITNVCISCHSDQNNDYVPFGDCKTPRQYAWDRKSIAARYQQNDPQKSVARWGKYSSATTNVKFKITKAFSAHGNAAANQGGWDPATGVDSTIANSRGGFANMSSQRQNVQCFDCHNSHGSKVSGTTSSYVNFSGVKNGGNLKEVTAGKGGYQVTYSAKGKAKGTGVVNPFNAGAGQCFDCHMTAQKGTKEAGGTPWGFQSTFGATQPIKGYRDGYRFGDRTVDGYRLPSIRSDKQIVGGHMQASSPLSGGKPVMGTIDGLCTPCHDPHGVSPSLGDRQKYAVPLLKDTWLSSPYREDNPAPDPRGDYATATTWGTPEYQARKYPTVAPESKYNTDRTTFSGSKIGEKPDDFAGLCLKCHPRSSLMGNYTGAANSPTNGSKAPWKSVERVHSTVKEWGKNAEHANPCSKCHQPHNSALPRLMQTNCLDYQHRGGRLSGGQVSTAYWMPTGDNWRTQFRGFPAADVLGNNGAADPTVSCHAGAEGNTGKTFPDPAWADKQYWNQVTPWPKR